jgi:hypothetical protein
MPGRMNELSESSQGEHASTAESGRSLNLGCLTNDIVSVSVAVACEPPSPSFHVPVRTILKFEEATFQYELKPVAQSDATRAVPSTGARAWALATPSNTARSSVTVPARSHRRPVAPCTTHSLLRSQIWWPIDTS